MLKKVFKLQKDKQETEKQIEFNQKMDNIMKEIDNQHKDLRPVRLIEFCVDDSSELNLDPFKNNSVVIDPYFNNRNLSKTEIPRYDTPFITMNLAIGDAAMDYSKLKNDYDYIENMAECDIDKYSDMMKNAFIDSICSRYDFFINSVMMQIENEIALFMKNNMNIGYRSLRIDNNNNNYQRLSPNGYTYQIRRLLDTICNYPKDMRNHYYNTLRLTFQNILLMGSMNDIFDLVSRNIQYSFQYYRGTDIQIIYQGCINKLTSLIYGSHDSAYYEMDSIMSTIIMNDDCFVYRLDRRSPYNNDIE